MGAGCEGGEGDAGRDLGKNGGLDALQQQRDGDREKVGLEGGIEGGREKVGREGGIKGGMEGG